MIDYRIFGNCLRSEIEFSELRRIRNGTPHWTLRVAHQRPPLHNAALLGSEDIGDGTTVWLYARTGGYRLAYNDSTGAFDVSADGRKINWLPAPDPDNQMVRLHVMGRVLATALHASGMYCLHGSGVMIGGAAIGFFAPRFWGKSTLALALAKAGARLLSDDTLAMDPEEDSVRLWPGVHSVRLWGDSAALVAGDDPAGGAPPFEVKRTFNAFPDHLLACQPTPLSALYLLAPYRGNGRGPVVQRTLLTPTLATLSLVAHAKIAALLGKSEASRLFDRAARVAARVPVYRLAFPRDFAHIASVVEQLGEWHRRSRDTEAPVL